MFYTSTNSSNSLINIIPCYAVSQLSGTNDFHPAPLSLDYRKILAAVLPNHDNTLEPHTTHTLFQHRYTFLVSVTFELIGKGEIATHNNHSDFRGSQSLRVECFLCPISSLRIIAFFTVSIASRNITHIYTRKNAVFTPYSKSPSPYTSCGYSQSQETHNKMLQVYSIPMNTRLKATVA